MAAYGEFGLAAVTLVVALAALVREISAWQQERGRAHQSTAAATAAASLRIWVETVAGHEGDHAVDHGSAGSPPQIDRAAGAALRRPRG